MFYPIIKKHRKAVLAALGVFLCLICLLPQTVTAASNTQKKIVRVAFFPMEGYNIHLADGGYGGMDVEYLSALSRYTDWQIEYVDCDSWDDALAKLQNKEVDLVGSAQYTDERALLYQYADLPSGYTFGAIAVNGDSSLAYEDFDAMKDITFGVVKTYVRKTEFLEYLANHGIDNPNIIEYENTADLQAALENGEVDAIVHTFMELNEGQRIVGRFAPTTYYYITYNGNNSLCAELNDAISSLKMNDPVLENNLMDEFYNSKLNNTEVLTLDEKNYVEHTKTLTVGYLDSNYPISYEENNTLQGLLRKSYDDFSARTGLSLTYQKMENTQAGINALNDGTIDIFSCCTNSEDLLNQNNVISVKDYASVPLAIIMKKDSKTSTISSLAVLSTLKSVADTALDTEYANVILYDDVLSCVNAVNSNIATAALCPSYPVDYLMQSQYNFRNIEIRNILNEDETYGIIINDTNKTLYDILSKALYEISDQEISEYILTYSPDNSLALLSWIEAHRVQLLVMLLLAVGIVYCVIIHMLHDSRKIQHLMYNDWELNVRNMNYLVYQGQKLLNSRHKAPYAIICLNLAQYSLYNTIYGWRFGNKLLNSVISLLSQHLDKTEELYSRNHEDHFVLMMQLDHSDSSIRRLEHLQQTIEQQIAKDTNQHINVDMGVAFITEEHSDIRSAIAQADQALEFLNDNPASHIQIYDKHLDFYLKETHDRESLLDTADINKDFVVYYQEKVDIRTENIIGAEALVRFIDPASPDTIRSPGYFISYYEKTGRIRELDFFVLESACRMLRRRIDEGKPVVPVSCNFSRCHFTKEEFPQQLVEVLNRYDIPKKLIEVEITETIVMDELQHTMIQQTLQELARLGIRFSIDDFGSGYSSLGVFEQIPASVIKLDRSFLLNHTDRDRQVKIMKYVVTLARSLDTMVVCEGIETDTDVELMKEIGAYIAQGYRYSKPAPENTFEKHLDIQQENHKKKQSFHMVRNSVSSL